MKRISEYNDITNIAENDVLPIVDVSDTSQATTGSTKKGTIEEIADYLKSRVETLTNKTISADDNTFLGFLDWFYPIGTIYETTSTDLDTTTKMNAHFGGTWEEYGSGRVLVAKSTDAEFDTIGETGGAKTHTLTTAEMPIHSHTVTQNFTRFASTGSNVPTVANTIHLSSVGSAFDNVNRTVTSSSSGSGSAHNNLQPYIVVYRYRRVS